MNVRTYWDSSALVESVFDPPLMGRLQAERGLTRPHSLAETFSVLTGNPELRLDADDAAKVLKSLSQHLDFVDLLGMEVVAAARNARKLGVRGGRIHDYLHVIAAEKAMALKILTLDKHDFIDLTGIEIEII